MTRIHMTLMIAMTHGFEYPVCIVAHHFLVAAFAHFALGSVAYDTRLGKSCITFHLTLCYPPATPRFALVPVSAARRRMSLCFRISPNSQGRLDFCLYHNYCFREAITMFCRRVPAPIGKVQENITYVCITP